MNKSGKIIFFTIVALFWASVYTYLPIFSPYCIQCGAETMLPAILGSYGFMQCLLRIPIGIWMDKLQKSRVFVLLGLLFGLVSAVGLYFSSTAAMLLVFRAFAGISASFYAAQTIAFTGYFRPEESVKAVGYINTANVVGTTIASLAGGFVSETMGDSAVFLVAAIMSLASVGLWFGTRETFVKRDPVRLQEFVNIIKNKLVLGISCLGAVFQYISFTVIAFSPVRGVQLKAGSAILGVLLFLFFLPTAAGSILAGKNKRGAGSEKSWLVASFAGSALACLVVVYTNSIAWLIVSEALAGFCSGIQAVYLTNFVLRGAPPSMRTTAVAFYQAVYSLGLFFGPLVTGLFPGVYLLNGYLLMGGLGAAGAIGAAFIRIPGTKASESCG
jgi:MFS family permease